MAKIFKEQPEEFDFDGEVLDRLATEHVLDWNEVKNYSYSTYRINDCNGDEGTLIFIPSIPLKDLVKKPKKKGKCHV